MKIYLLLMSRARSLDDYKVVLKWNNVICFICLQYTLFLGTSMTNFPSILPPILPPFILLHIYLSVYHSPSLSYLLICKKTEWFIFSFCFIDYEGAFYHPVIQEELKQMKKGHSKQVWKINWKINWKYNTVSFSLLICELLIKATRRRSYGGSEHVLWRSMEIYV